MLFTCPFSLAAFPYNLSRNNIALQVEIVLQKVKVAYKFSTKIPSTVPENDFAPAIITKRGMRNSKWRFVLVRIFKL